MNSKAAAIPKPCSSAPHEDHVAYYAAFFTEDWLSMVSVCNDCERELEHEGFSGRWCRSARGASSSVTWLEVIGAMQRPHPNQVAEELISRFALALVTHKLRGA